MKLVDRVRGIGKITPVIESGSMEQLMQFLTMGDVPHGRIARRWESTDSPINTIRCWRRELLRSPGW
jgi:hypothetical protein